MAKLFLASLIAIFLLFGASAPKSFYSFAQTSGQSSINSGVSAQDNNEKRKALEAELLKYEKEIEAHEATIDSLKKQGKSLSSEIKKLNEKIAKINLQVKATALNLKKLDDEINTTETKIASTEGEISVNKEYISEILREFYESEQNGLLEIILKSPKLSDFFGRLNNLLEVQDKMVVLLKKIVELKEELIDNKEVLAVQRADTQALKDYQDTQKAGVQKTQKEKNNLLETTKGKEVEYQKILTQTKKSAAEIRKQIFQILGGGELNFDEAYKLAKFAESATGVRAALILAVLDRESALGKNVGRCDYKTAMHPKRDIPIFLEIVKELDLIGNLESGLLKVSCANGDGAYGGAMGPAQFIPSTWKIYKNRVAEITGNNPANPWKNSDAFVATALYLKDAGAANASLSQERVAAAKYYAGGRWQRFLWTYGDRVVSLAKKFQDDIDILNS
mgnify:CR=1 FL=1